MCLQRVYLIEHLKRDVKKGSVKTIQFAILTEKCEKLKGTLKILNYF